MVDHVTGEVYVLKTYFTVCIMHVMVPSHLLAGHSSIQLVVRLTDVNDNAPQFTSLPVNPEVSENAMIGTIVEVVGASDADQGTNAQLTYTIIRGNGQGRVTLSTVLLMIFDSIRKWTVGRPGNMVLELLARSSPGLTEGFRI